MYTDQYFRTYKKIFNLRLSPSEFSVLSVLISHDFNPEKPREVFPSKDTIREHIAIGKGKLDQTLAILEYAGLIIIEERKRTRGRPAKLYKLADFETMDPFFEELIRDKLVEARRLVKDNTPRQGDNKAPRQSDNTTPRAGFIIPLEEPDIITPGQTVNIAPREGGKINNIKSNNLKSISEKAPKKSYKIIGEINIAGQVYKFRDDRIVWDERSRKEYDLIDIKVLFNEDHPVNRQARLLYPPE